MAKGVCAVALTTAYDVWEDVVVCGVCAVVDVIVCDVLCGRGWGIIILDLWTVIEWSD